MAKKSRVNELIKNPRKAFFILSIPILISMFVQTTYNIVDTAFIGRMGSEPIAALTFTFPIIFILVTINASLGIGMGARISRMLGAKNKKEAENTAMHGIILSLIFALALFILNLVFLRGSFILLGASGNVLEYSMQYMSIIMGGIFLMFPAYVMSNIFSAQGNTKIPMKIQIISMLTNIILDPIFIYTLKLGVAGAAIATVISFGVALILSIYYLRKYSHLEINFNQFKYSKEVIRDIIAIGLPSSLMMLMVSIYAMFANRIMVHFGVDYVAAFGISTRLESVVTTPIIAFAISMVTIVGMLYGAKKYGLLRDTIRYCIKTAILITIGIGALGFIFSHLLVRIFTSDPNLISLSAAYLRISIFSYPFLAITMITSRALHGMRLGMPGFVINAIRVLVLAVPISYLFVFLFDFGYISVAVASILGAAGASIIAYILLEKAMIKINRKG
ncbi:MAG: MATE family efflux transporter [archaeon]